MAKKHLKLISLSVVILGIAFLGFAFVYDSPPTLPPLHSLRSYQDADAPPGYPVGVTEDDEGRVPEFDSRFLMLDAFERFAMPTAVEFSSPLGPQNGLLTESLARFGNRAGDRGGEVMLLGDQLLGLGEAKVGEPVPVRASGNGLVLFAGPAAGQRGEVLILGHRLEDGRLIQSFYGGLQRIDVPRGDVVSRGKVIGLLDPPEGPDARPLHFEFRESDGMELGPISTKTVQNRLDPGVVRTHHEAAGETVLAPPALAFRARPTWDGSIRSRQDSGPD